MKLLKSELFHVDFSKFYATFTSQARAVVWNDLIYRASPPIGGGVFPEDGKENCRINLRNFQNENIRSY